MTKQKDEIYLAYKVKGTKDVHSKTLDEGFMSIDKAMALLRKMMKRKMY